MNDAIFSTLPPSAITTISIEKDGLLFKQGDPATGFYEVVAGEVVMQRLNKEGFLLTVHRARRGGYFAEASIFSENYHCDAICVKQGLVRKIAKDAVLGRMATDQPFSLSFTSLLAKQVQSARATTEIIAIRSAKERVITAIYSGLFDSTVVDLASRIGLSHEACYRALRQLCDEGRLIHLGRGEYVLPDAINLW